MASEILLVNPRRRRRRKARATKRRVRRTSRRRRSTAVAVAAPRRRRRRRSRSVARVTSRVRYRRNPRLSARGIVGNITGALLPSAIAAGGALGVDVLLGYVPLPEKLKAGPVRHLTRGVGAIAVGTVAGFLFSAEIARSVMAGGLTVAFHGAFREGLTKVAPNVRLGGVGDYDDDISALEEDLQALLTVEERAPVNELGAFDPAFSGFVSE